MSTAAQAEVLVAALPAEDHQAAAVQAVAAEAVVAVEVAAVVLLAVGKMSFNYQSAHH